MFRLHMVGNVGGDETAMYEVDLDREYTVDQFVHDVLLNNREWGTICINNGDGMFSNPKCEYKYGELVSKLPIEYLPLRVVSAKAHGGWSLMDYSLTVEPCDSCIVPVTEHYGIYQEDIYGDAWFVVCKLPDEKIAKFKNKSAALNECKYLERLDAKKKEE